METQQIEIREQQKQTWNKFSGGWKKWDEFTMQFLKPMGEAIIAELDIRADDNVLDVACGTGEPGLTIAGIVKTGKVTGTDLAEQMLDIADENAKKKGLQNYETIACDVCDLPFPDNSYDKISCRMGFMFFPDMQLASDQMFRVLKQGGKMATSVWGRPADNAWITLILGIINKKMQLPPPPAGAPGMFRCAGDGVIKNIMENSGFRNIKEQEIKGKLLYEDFNQLWSMMNEVAAPVVAALSKADDEMRNSIRQEVEMESGKYKTSKGLEIDYSSFIISGEK